MMLPKFNSYLENYMINHYESDLYLKEDFGKWARRIIPAAALVAAGAFSIPNSAPNYSKKQNTSSKTGTPIFDGTNDTSVPSRNVADIQQTSLLGNNKSIIDGNTYRSIYKLNSSKEIDQNCKNIEKLKGYLKQLYEEVEQCKNSSEEGLKEKIVYRVSIENPVNGNIEEKQVEATIAEYLNELKENIKQIAEEMVDYELDIMEKIKGVKVKEGMEQDERDLIKSKTKEYGTIADYLLENKNYDENDTGATDLAKKIAMYLEDLNYKSVREF
jgi:hypothetical protein